MTDHTASTPVFSVIMPTHHRPEMLSEAVASVLNQSLEQLELIVIDDASPTPADVPADPRIRLVRNDASQGPAAARNRGLSIATGEFVAFLDDDDLWTRDRLAHALAAHEDHDVVVCSAGRVGNDVRSVRHVGRGRTHDWILDQTAPHLGATSVRRELCPAFDHTYPTAEDLDWWLRLTQHVDVHFMPDADWLWRRHAGVRHGIGVERRLEGRRLLMSRHASYFASHRKARSFSWRRIGILSLDLDRRGQAAKAGLRSLMAYPTPGGLNLLIKSASPRSFRSSE